MKTLLLLRHAKSSWDDPTLPDHDRPLNPRGKKAAPRMGVLLRDEGLLPDLIVTSTAKRARKTAKIVAETSGYTGPVVPEPALYFEGAGAYLAAIHAADADITRLMLVGHNPDMEEVIHLLTGRVERMPTAALAAIDLNVARWDEVEFEQAATLTALWRPRELE